MELCQDYHIAKNVDDALQALANASGSVRIIAGGTDLLLDLQQGRHEPVHTLVDVTGIPEMKALEIRGDELYIGASVTHNRIVASPIAQDNAQALVEACGLIGGPQVRNTATLGGNVAHALPAGDGTIALMALAAQAEIADRGGRRRVSLQSLFVGPGKSILHPREEVLVGFYLPLRKSGQASAFERVMRPQGVAIAILNCAVWLQRIENRIVDVRISVGPSGPIPRLLHTAEEALRGREYNADVLRQAATALLVQASLRTSRHRATSDYRKHLATILLENTFLKAWERSG